MSELAAIYPRKHQTIHVRLANRNQRLRHGIVSKRRRARVPQGCATRTLLLHSFKMQQQNRAQPYIPTKAPNNTCPSGKPKSTVAPQCREQTPASSIPTRMRHSRIADPFFQNGAKSSKEHHTKNHTCDVSLCCVAGTNANKMHEVRAGVCVHAACDLCVCVSV